MNKKLMSYKDYASKYKISTIKTIGKKGNEKWVSKSVNELLNDIYEYEKKNKVKNGLYPFLYVE
jgi:hypothetical protein